MESSRHWVKMVEVEIRGIGQNASYLITFSEGITGSRDTELFGENQIDEFNASGNVIGGSDFWSGNGNITVRSQGGAFDVIIGDLRERISDDEVFRVPTGKDALDLRPTIDGGRETIAASWTVRNNGFETIRFSVEVTMEGDHIETNSYTVEPGRRIADAVFIDITGLEPGQRINRDVCVDIV